MFKHPNVATRDQVATPTTKALLQQTPEVTTLGKYIQTMTDNGVPYGKHVQAVNRDGTPAQLLIKGQLKTFTTIQLNSTDSTFTGNMTSAVVAGVHGVKNTGSLGTVVNQPLDALQDKKDTSTWHTPEGTLPTVTAYSASPAADSTVTATVANSGLLYGTYTTASPYANGQVPVKLYNNFVRWVTVYVQYLDAAGNNLSHVTTGPPPKWPDTTYAKSLGILPQIFTLLGVPIWDTNTLTATLDFPDNAVKANILFCGLGNGAAEGGWQQYFQGAYPADAIAPKNEVLVPALITGILSIGLTAFALCIDLDIATTWNALRKITEDNIEALEGLLVSLLADAPWATAAETFAMTVAAGAATYTDISANGGGQNVWSVICNALMSMLPKILMNPATNLFWVDVVALIFSDEALEKAIDLIPVAGMIFAAIAAAGDAVTLAEAIGESAASPWVIGNSISLTYPVTVTVGYDKQRASTWPETATSWKLMAAIDGTTVLAPVVGPLNVGGRTGNSPIVFPWTAPFGGDNITWSIASSTPRATWSAAGPCSCPTTVPRPPATSASTSPSYPRRSTPTACSPAATPSSTTTPRAATPGPARRPTPRRGPRPPRSRRSPGSPCRPGSASPRWCGRANDKYWLRGISAIEDATTLTMGEASKQGYARRPFVLFDPFVGPADAGNHVLLEPDDVLDGYHVRRLQVDATTGSLTWRSDTSIGWFPLAVDAATLTASGWVVTIHTNSGRVGQVLPEPDRRAPAGPVQRRAPATHSGCSPRRPP